MNIRLGDYDPALPPKITPCGITYYPYGLDDYGPKRVRKACNKMTEAGVEAYIIAEFREWALRLPAELATWIDIIYEARLADWRGCIGAALPNARRITTAAVNGVIPGSFRVYLHPEPFPVADRGGILTAGVAYDDRIEAVGAYLSNGNTWLRRCDRLIEWELGNLIARRCGYVPMDVAQEIGNKRPCV